ncbi:MAG: hypothetical protein JRF55_16395, partial [Deltaproteobacteria bacterium]|nr:hypothetical protein [Deltaproteobacteria bacterium]
MNYRLAYWLGLHPWEDAATDAPFAAKITEMFEREESGREPPYGPALDIGTGSGIWAVELAKRGWQVKGDRRRLHGGHRSALRARTSRRLALRKGGVERISSQAGALWHSLPGA